MKKRIISNEFSYVIKNIFVKLFKKAWSLFLSFPIYEWSFLILGHCALVRRSGGYSVVISFVASTLYYTLVAVVARQK